jgi:hypothetical protein
MSAMKGRARRLGLLTASLFLIAAAPGLAQTGSGWTDPPVRPDGPAQADESSSSRPPALSFEEDYEAPPPAPPAAPAPSAVQRPRASAPPGAGPAPPASTASPEPATPRRYRSVRRPGAPETPAPAAGAQPRGGEPSGALARTARQLAVEYLGYWSAPNAVALSATPDFYAPKVVFHGRVMSARALADEKRRFVQRWPQRYYTPRLATMRTACARAGDVCTVRTVFDFTAADPSRGARSQGVANLELGVAFADGRPKIVFENSRVTRRGRSPRSAAMDGGSE